MNRLGRVAFVLLCVVAFALLLVAVLVFAGIGVKDQSDATPPSARGSGGGKIAYAPTTTAVPATTADPPATSTSSATTEPPPQVAGRATPAVLVVTAARGDCWLEVHRGSQTGAVRFAATLPLGQTIRFQGSRFWVRFGGAANVDVRFGGKPVLMPSGTVALVLARPTRA